MADEKDEQTTNPDEVMDAAALALDEVGPDSENPENENALKTLKATLKNSPGELVVLTSDGRQIPVTYVDVDDRGRVRAGGADDKGFDNYTMGYPAAVLKRLNSNTR